MSIFQDVSAYIGAGSVPVIVGGFVYGVFEFGEKLASPQAKEALTQWLQTADVQKVARLPPYTMEMFQRIFGERHFSFKCLWRSAAFSIGSMIIVFIIIQLATGAKFLTFLDALEEYQLIISISYCGFHGLLSWIILVCSRRGWCYAGWSVRQGGHH
jgi:hypothetical protein